MKYLAFLFIVLFALAGCSPEPHKSIPELKTEFTIPTEISRKDVRQISRWAIQTIAREIERLKPKYRELADFSTACISQDGLTLHYKKNVIKGTKGTVLGEGEACEIVVSFSDVIHHGISAIPWGNYTIIYKRLNWQVYSYPAIYGWKEYPGGHRFVRSQNFELCETIYTIVTEYLKPLEELESSK